jgi:hypothetical protein
MHTNGAILWGDSPDLRDFSILVGSNDPNDPRLRVPHHNPDELISIVQHFFSRNNVYPQEVSK